MRPPSPSSSGLRSGSRPSSKRASCPKYDLRGVALATCTLLELTHDARTQIGPKLINKIEEFLKTGKIQEARRSWVAAKTFNSQQKPDSDGVPYSIENILASNEYKVLTALNTVHGIGCVSFPVSSFSEPSCPLTCMPRLGITGSKTAVKLYEDYKVRTLQQALPHLKPPEQELFRKYHADLSEK